MTARFIVADVFDGLATLEDGSVDLVVTSPPFLALRSYLPADHPDKNREIGSEATPAEFLDVMLRVTQELRRVLAPHGSICVELGDTYAGSGGAGGDYDPGGWRQGQDAWDGSSRREQASNHKYAGEWANPGFGDGFKGGNPGGAGWPLAKSKTLIPELYRIALAYGRNPLRAPLSARELLWWVEQVVENMREAGAPLDGFDLLKMMTDYVSQVEEIGPYKEYERWRIRNVVTWCRPNPPVGALGDKWRPATSDVVVACVSSKRFWDDLATRKQHQTPPTGEPDFTQAKRASDTRPPGGDSRGYMMHHGSPSGAPLLDYWEISLLDDEEPRPYGPKEKPREPGRAMQNRKSQESPVTHLSSAQGSGDEHPSGPPLLDYWVIPPGGYPGSHYAVFPPELVVPLVKAMCPERVCRACGEPSRRIVDSERGAHWEEPARKWDAATRNGGPWTGGTVETKYDTLGFTDCGHDDWRPGLILDPFAGSGTTLAVAQGHGHDAIGIDLDERNLELARERVGPMFFEEVTLEEAENV